MNAQLGELIWRHTWRKDTRDGVDESDRCDDYARESTRIPSGCE